MPKLQHQKRRGPNEVILVGGSQYELDEHGCVDVTDEDAAKMLQGVKWRPEGEWPALPPAPPPLTAAPGGGRRSRTRSELEELAAAEGILVEPSTAPADPEPEKETPTIEINPNMRKSQLVAVAEQLNLDVEGLTKREVYEALEAHAASQED